MQRLLVVILLLLSACVSTPKRTEPDSRSQPIQSLPTQVKCIDCGVVQDIRTVKSNTQAAAPKKPVLSGIVGGVVSKPSTSKSTTHYEIAIQMLSGKKVVITQTLLSPGLRIGSKVRVSQGRILAVGP